MATIVKSDLYESIDGKLHEIKRQIRQKEGYPYDPQRLNFELQAIIEGQFGVNRLSNVKLYPSDALASSYGFTVVEDVTPSKFRIKDLELVPFLKTEDRDMVNGATLRSRAVTLKANLGLVDAQRMLDIQTEISSEFRDKALLFTGTLLRGSVGDLRVAYLCWRGGRWFLYFYHVGSDFNDNGRLVRCNPASTCR